MRERHPKAREETRFAPVSPSPLRFSLVHVCKQTAQFCFAKHALSFLIPLPSGGTAMIIYAINILVCFRSMDDGTAVRQTLDQWMAALPPAMKKNPRNRILPGSADSVYL